MVVNGQRVDAAVPVQEISGLRGGTGRRGGGERGEAAIAVGEEGVRNGGGAEDRGEEGGVAVRGGAAVEGMEHGDGWV